MKLIDDIKGAWRHFSTIALALGTAIQGAWIAYPADLKLGLPPTAVSLINYALGAVLLWGLVGKFIDQTPKAPPPKE